MLGCRKRPHDPRWVCAEYRRDLQELDHIEPTLATLVLGNEGLRPTELIGDILLGETGLLSCRNQQLAQLGMLGRMDRLAHAGRHEPQQLIPGPDYPK
jgi:hypothetical protein